MRIARTKFSAEEIKNDSMVCIEELFTNAELEEAVSKGCIIYEIDEQGNVTGEPLFDGKEWRIEGKLEATEETNAESIEIPEVSYIDQRAEVIQSEIESLVDVMAVSLPTNAKLKVLKQHVATARQAMSSKDDQKMATIAATLSATDDAPIFTLETEEE